ncbi:MAG: sulfur carrier protein ThiS [Myxococcales bacterium]|nr:sulfur carrier protein ThiS [Myxococcales bacterium]
MATPTLTITVNGDPVSTPHGATVRGLLTQLGLPHTTAVERNQRLVPRAQHSETELCEGDVLEMVQLVGGG